MNDEVTDKCSARVQWESPWTLPRPRLHLPVEALHKKVGAVDIFCTLRQRQHHDNVRESLRDPA